MIKTLKTTLVLIMLTLMALPAMAKINIGVSMAWFDDNFLTNVREAIAAQAKQYPDVSIQFEDARGDITHQLDQVQNFIARGVDVIIVNPADTAATQKITDKVHSAGIGLVYVNRRPEAKEFPDRVAFVGSNEHDAGLMQAEFLVKKLNGKGNVAIMLGELSSEGTRGRTAGFKDGIKDHPGIKVVEEQTANFFRSPAMDLMNNWIVSGVKLDAVVCNNDEMAIGAIMAIKQAGLDPKKILVTGVDATADALAAMKQGDLAMTVFQDAKGQGSKAVDLAVALAKKEKVEPLNWIPFQPVDQSNYQKFISK